MDGSVLVYYEQVLLFQDFPYGKVILYFNGHLYCSFCLSHGQELIL